MDVDVASMIWLKGKNNANKSLIIIEKPRSLESRRLPCVALDLHHGGLFVREADLPFFMEANLLQISDKPKI